MATVVEIAGKSLAIGIDWSVHEDSKALSEARREAGKRISYFETEVDEAILLGVYDGQAPKGALIGALVVAAAFQDAVVCHEIDDSQVWVCGILNGVPMPGHDRIVSIAEAQEEVAALLSNHPDARMVGQVSGSMATLADVVKMLPAGKAKQMRLKAGGVNLKVVAAVAILPLVVGGALFGYNGWKKHQQEVAEALAMEQAAAQQAYLAKQRAAASQQASDAKVAATRRAMVEGVKAFDQFSAWMGVLNAVPQFHDGYRLDAMRCGAGGSPTNCELVWKGNDRPGMKPSPFAALGLPGKSTVTNESDPQALVSEVKTRWEVPALPMVMLETDAPDGLFKVVERARAMGIEVRTTPASPISVPSEGTPGAQPVQVVVGRKGTWSLASTGVVQARALMDVLRDMGWRLRTLNVEGVSAAKLTVTMEGDYVLAPR